MKILLVEDERDMSRVVSAVLRHEGYDVDVAPDGVVAVELVNKESYDCIVMDVMMPRKDGITALREIRASGDMTPIIMLTAKAEIEDRIQGLDSGADDYITKPFSIKELLARVRSMTRRQATFTSNVLELGNVSLSKYTFELSTDKDKVRLSNKEYQMMEMLMRNPGNVIQTEQFLERIWGYDSDSEINVVWVNISYLRKKLKALDANIQIKATRNVGYTLEIVDVQES